MLLLGLSFSFPERDHTPIRGSAGFLERATFYMSFSVYPLRDRDHMWNARFGGEVKVYRGLGFTAHFEFVADPYSPIFFRPRSVYFSEGVVYSFDRFAVAYFHRCKHDVDALKRTLILSGPRVYLFLGDLTLKADVYPIRYDRAYPEVARLNIEGMMGSVGANVQSGYWEVYVNLDFFKYTVMPEFGVKLKGYSGDNVRLIGFLAFERFYDTGMNGNTTPAFLGSVGVRSEGRILGE